MPKNDEFDLQNFLPYLLNQAAERSSLEFQQVYKGRYGMLRTEWRVLFHLGIYGAMTAKSICARAKMHKTKISRAVQKLEDRRYLTRTPVETDRRSEQLTLTAAGQAVYRDLMGVARAYDGKLVAGFSAADTDRLRAMLRHLAGVQP